MLQKQNHLLKMWEFKYSRVSMIMKSKRPRTEPRGTPYSEVCKEEKQSLHFTQKVRDER